jgi:bisphosphoglycerate-independent phosphoglycerate mutase (AlkP superfamily)
LTTVFEYFRITSKEDFECLQTKDMINDGSDRYASCSDLVIVLSFHVPKYQITPQMCVITMCQEKFKNRKNKIIQLKTLYISPALIKKKLF